MMISPEMYAEQFKDASYQEMIKERDSLIRYIRKYEKLETEIKVGELIHTIEYDYPTFHLSMDCFWCEIVKGDLVLKEAEDARWLTKNQLYDVKWLLADVRLISIIEECF